MATPLSLSDHRQIDTLLEGSASSFSEYCFANLYLFRHRHDYKLDLGPVPHVVGTTYDGVRHALPLGNPGPELLIDLLDRVGCIYPVSADVAALLGDRVAASYEEADSDYLFAGERLATLSGAKKKRAQARAFEKDVQPWARAMTMADTGSATDILNGWMSDVSRAPPATDHAECTEALALFERLDLEGLLVGTGEGEAVAFLLASRRPDGTRIVHFAKGRRAHAGAYPWMFAHYAAMTGAPFLNFEQDLGNPAFAQAKQALGPIAHLRKYRLRRI